LSPELASAIGSAATFTTRRHDQQEEQLARLAEELPLYELRVPYVTGEEIGPDELGLISGALKSGIEGLRSRPPDAAGESRQASGAGGP
jgi:hypothetical protein